jgi:sugar transferase (PEP-CTERM/EpsH1 system associated)
MRILFLAHCAPNAPDKGEKIRAHHTVLRLSRIHELHVACFAREQDEVDSLRAMEDRCASVYAELVSSRASLMRSAFPFALGGCLNLLFYQSRTLARHVRELHAAKPFDAAIVYSTPMAQYVPEGIPYILDMQDVDSEKWLQYATDGRLLGPLYRIEALRLRKKEVEFARGARRTFFVTRAEELLFREFAGEVATGFIENGWGVERHESSLVPTLPELAHKRYIALVGSMDYYPNVQGARWFARNIFPELRKEDPALEFYIVGRSPTRAVRALGRLPGVTVTGTVPDPRPYVKSCLATVAPLQLARGIQLKVIESLALGKPVLISPAVAKTFGGAIPPGAIVCETADDYCLGLRRTDQWPVSVIRAEVSRRFDGYRNLDRLDMELAAIGCECNQQ